MPPRPPLEDLGLSYDQPGITDGLPGIGSGQYRRFQKTVSIGTGADQWNFASHEVLRWGVKYRSGFTVHTPDNLRSHQKVVPGQSYWLVARLGIRIREPVRVISVIEESDRVGFAYGTLAGHPLSGEESFVVDRTTAGSVNLTITSFSRPGVGPWRHAFSLITLAQRWYRFRYFRALAPARR